MKQQGLVSFLIFAIGLTLFHQLVFPMFLAKSGLNPGRYIYFAIWLVFLIGTHLVLRLKPNMSLKGLYVFCAGFYFYKFVLYPPIPWTLLLPT